MPLCHEASPETPSPAGNGRAPNHALDQAALCETVRYNCGVTDARHACDYAMCVYLLKMREYYRWERGHAFDEALPKADLGAWLSEREALWRRLEGRPFRKLRVAERAFDPFDTAAINRRLNRRGYVYSGGFGGNGVPHFFLGRLESRQTRGGVEVLVSAAECARDLAAPPAMSLDGVIFVRRESIRRMIWEKLTEWRWNRARNAMATAFSYYDFDGDLERALDDMTQNEIETVILHELGEIEAGRLLGKRWYEMLARLPRSRAELMARAVKDNLADSIAVLPALVGERKIPSLHFHVASLTAMRKRLFPALTDAYRDWRRGGSIDAIEELATPARRHWRRTAHRLLEAFERDGENAAPRIEALCERAAL